MSTSLTAQMNALTTIGTSEDMLVYVLDAPKKPVDLMETMKVIIERDGFAKATQTFLSCHWLRIDPSTKAGEDKYAVAGYGIALPKNGVALRQAKSLRPLGRFIKMTEDFLTRFTLRTTDNRGLPCVPYWSKAGANSTLALRHKKASGTKKASRAMASKPSQKANGKVRTQKANGKFSVVMTNEQVLADAKVMAQSDPKKGVGYVRRFYKGNAEDALAELLAAA